MRVLGSIVALVMLLSVIQAAFALVALLMIGMFLWGLLTNPARTLAFVGIMLLLNLIGRHPGIAAVMLALGAVAMMASPVDSERKRS